jgi:hypothetical protein
MAARLTINQSNLKNDTVIRREIIMYRCIITVLICLTAVPSGAAKNPSALELLDKYAETQDQFQSFRAKVTTLRKCFSSGLMAGKPWKGRYVTEKIVCFDKDRASSRSCSWGKMNQKDYFPKNKPHYKSELWDGKNHFQYTEVRGEPVNLNIKKGKGDEKREGIIKQSYSMFSGYYYPFDGRVDKLLRRARGLSVRHKREKVGRSHCYVIEGVYEKDKYTIWLDPEHGYNIVKAVVERPQSNVQGLQGFRVELKNIRFKKIDGRWVPVSANLEDRFDYNNGHYCTDSYQTMVTEIVFNPDHDSLGSFIPDDIKNDTKVPFYTGSPHRIYEPQYIWSREATFVADRKGRLRRYEPDKGILPVVKTLPKFDMFDLKLEPDETKDKMILLCFVDIEQASQKYAYDLAARASKLADKDILVIFVDASGSEKKQIDIWARQNSIKVPVGRFHKKLLKEIHQAWGIETLPRLVLTDRNHAIVAEGFTLEEMVAKIKEASL